MNENKQVASVANSKTSLLPKDVLDDLQVGLRDGFDNGRLALKLR